MNRHVLGHGLAVLRQRSGGIAGGFEQASEPEMASRVSGLNSVAEELRSLVRLAEPCEHDTDLDERACATGVEGLPVAAPSLVGPVVVVGDHVRDVKSSLGSPAAAAFRYASTASSMRC